MNRVNVSVQCSTEPDGIICPRKVRCEDGRVWYIELVLYTCRIFDLSFEVVRYTVLIEGMEKYLYQSGRQWYVFVA